MDIPTNYLPKESLDEILVSAGMVTAEQMQNALQTARTEGKTVEQALVEEGLVTPHDLLRVLSIQLKVPLIDLRRHKVNPEALKLVPERLARKYNILPVDIVGGSLIVAMGDTTDIRAIDDISTVSKMRIEPMMAFPDEIREEIDHKYTIGDKIRAEAATAAPPAVTKEIKPDKLMTAEAEVPALRNLNLLIQQAVRSRASDIHIEPQEDTLQVRFRIDGVLRSTAALSLTTHAAIISRLKIMSGMNIAEQRRPQDGQFSVSVDDKDIDIRVACGNTIHGEMAVLRLLPKSASLLELSDLGFLPSTLKEYEKILKLPFGMILLGGPTGSGKTTTLYASVHQLDQMARNIMTIEDPVEYHLDGINQFQVNPKADISFVSSLRAFMRLDPDVILVGEIRDGETAQIATQAALTGHLVFSSIHANDAVGVMLRLLDLGVEPFLVCSALVGAVSQRIVRRICPHCRETHEPPEEERIAYQEEMGEVPANFYKGTGCNLCADTGYLGQIGILEVLAPSEEVKRLLMSGATATQIRTQAIKDGMLPLMHDGMLKVKDGVTTVTEVLRSVFSINY